MDFIIADTFVDSLARLTPDEQKAAKNTAFDLQMNRLSPGMNYHPLRQARDKSFSSVRVNDDIRLIVHRTASSLLLCYVDHHDKAYEWAERRKLEIHPKTGAAQWVKFLERVEEIILPRYVEGERPSAPSKQPLPLLFAHFSDDSLLNYGVPADWIPLVKEADEDSLLELAEHLPTEAAEALLELATGNEPRVRNLAIQQDPFDHPDATRRFRMVAGIEELRLALEFPWDKWTVFLHPAQRELVEREYSGPAKVSGSAGTGKTIVALHRAVFSARKDPHSRILLTTFSEALAAALHDRIRRLVSQEPRLGERIDIESLNSVGERLHKHHFGSLKLLSREELRTRMVNSLSRHDDVKFSANFLSSEWWEIVDANQLQDWPSYRDVKRLGRRTRLSEKVRTQLWEIFDKINRGIEADGLVTYSAMFVRLANLFLSKKLTPFDHIIVDECQDISPAQLTFVAALGTGREKNLFFTGDLGQRIFQLPFSWLARGIDIRGRSRTLTVNYRTSHQIRRSADRLLGPNSSDVDGNTENRKGTVSLFNGPDPVILKLASIADEQARVGAWIRQRIDGGAAPHEIAVIVRSESELTRAVTAVTLAGLDSKALGDRTTSSGGKVCVCTMPVAKGLEFRSVAIMACDDDIVPLQTRIGEITDEADLAEVYATERHLLYVAATRSREDLLITSGGNPSEFIDDLL